MMIITVSMCFSMKNIDNNYIESIHKLNDPMYILLCICARSRSKHSCIDRANI